MIKINLKPKKEQAIQRRHPWIFSGAIRNIEGEAEDGDAVEVYSCKNEFLAVGHWHDGSIAVRILSYKKRKLDASFWQSQIKKAADYRQFLGFPNGQTNCYRLVHGEGDGLSGLVVDVYGSTAVLQCHTIGMHREREAIAKAIVDNVEAVEAVFDKSRASLPERYANSIENAYLIGNSEPQNILENGHQFYVDWERGQKTGFFLDQRDNRQMLTKYAKGKKVLNAFCYSGGFSVYAMQAGASEVHSIDVSKKAMDWTDKNIELNPTDCPHESIKGKVLDYLKDTDPYEVMVVDPPAFAKRIAKRHNAVQGYKRLNTMAMQKIAPGGVLFTFSCSQVIDRQLFYNTIVAAAIEAGRAVKVMHHLSQPADHPVNLFHPEGAYLKGLVLRVE